MKINDIFKKVVLKLAHSVILWLLLLGFSNHANAQDKISAALKNLAEKYTQEKIHINFNKDSYVAGESIWMKAFVFSGYEVSAISTNLYVEIYNANKVIVANRVYPIVNGLVDASITLSDSLSEGIYYVRAYTTWMLNFDPSFHYLQPIVVYNPNSKMALIKTIKDWDIIAQPESGVLIDGIDTKVAVRFINNGSSKVDWKGYIIDVAQPSIKIARFTPSDPNVAVFAFTPQFGKDYIVVVEDSTKKSKQFKLPIVSNKGAMLSVSQQDTILDYSISFKGYKDAHKYTLVGTIQNDLVYKLNFTNKDSLFYRSISTYKMPKGVIHFTLFDADDHVLCERLSFLQQKTAATFQFDSTHISNQPRGYNELWMHLDSGFNYHLMVFSGNTNPQLNDLNANIWLNSDFKRPIQYASNYFNHPDAKHLEALDAIMMSEKWERFNWATLLQSQAPQIKYADANYLSYTGVVLYKNKPLVNETLSLILFYPDSTRQFMQAITDSAGKFILDGLLFEGVATVSYKFLNKKLNKAYGNLEFKTNSISVLSPVNLPITNDTLVSRASLIVADENRGIALDAFQLQKQLQQNDYTLAAAVVKTRRKTATQELVDKVVSGRYSYPRERFVDFVNTEQPSLDLSARSWLNGRMEAPMPKNSKDKSVLFYIDERLADLDELNYINMQDVSLIKFAGQLDKHFVFFYLKKGGESNAIADPLSKATIQGYTKSAPYILPNYFNDAFKKLGSDNRALLYWGNGLNKEALGEKAVIQFFNNDHPTGLKVYVFGTDADGGAFSSWVEVK